MTKRTNNPRGNPTWTKGMKTPNPNGRPYKGQSLAEKVRDALEEAREGEPTHLNNLIDREISLAYAGNQSAIEYLLARGYGRMVDRIEVTPKQSYDLSKLTDEELETFMVLQRKLETDED